MVKLLTRGAFLLSGVAGLTFEIVWLRHLGLSLGATTLAVASTTAAYMGGLTLGAALAAKVADRLKRPLSVYGVLEIAIALTGIFVPIVCGSLHNLDALFSNDVSGTTRAVSRFVAAALILLLPTTAMGATLPILAKAVTKQTSDLGKEIGILYGLNLAGAMIGAALAGFAWIPAYGLSFTNFIAVGIDGFLGIATFLGGLFVMPIEPAKLERSENRNAARPMTVYHGALFFSGAAAMVLQVLWTRALGTALGPSTYAFSSIVCAYLLGLAIGSWIAAALSRHSFQPQKLLVVFLLLAANLALFGIALVDDLPLLLKSFIVDPSLTVRDLVRTEFTLAALSLVPATTAMGTLFPLTLVVINRSPTALGNLVGRAYAVNTLGNIVGCFVAVFVFLPLFGIEWGMRTSLLFYCIAAGGVLFHESHDKRKRWFTIATGTTAILVLVFPAWDIGQWTSGLFRLSMTRNFYADEPFVASELVFHKDGLSTTVTVEQEAGVRWIKVNGKIDGSSEGDMPTQILSGLLPMFFHPDPKNVAVIGCGSGVTIGAALQGNPEHITLIELEKQVVEGAKFFANVNHKFWEDPRLQIIEDDGRNFLARHGSPFDVIISEPSNPWMTGAASLFTREFFQVATRRLNDDGIFLQWLQTYELAPERILSVLKTFQTVFPHILIFSAHADSNDLLILGSRKPLDFPAEKLQKRFDIFRDELKRAEIENVHDLFALALYSDRELAEEKMVPLNTDNNAFVEFGAPKDLLTFAEDDPDTSFLQTLKGRRVDLLLRFFDRQSLSFDALAQSYLRHGLLKDAHYAAIQHLKTIQEVSTFREIRELIQLLDEVDYESVIDVEYARADATYRKIAELVVNGEHEKAADEFSNNAALAKTNPKFGLLYAYVLYQNSQFSDAQRQLSTLDKNSVAVQYYLARNSYFQGEYDRGIEQMRKYQTSRKRNLSLDTNNE